MGLSQGRLINPRVITDRLDAIHCVASAVMHPVKHHISGTLKRIIIEEIPIDGHTGYFGCDPVGNPFPFILFAQCNIIDDARLAGDQASDHSVETEGRSKLVA